MSKFVADGFTDCTSGSSAGLSWPLFKQFDDKGLVGRNSNHGAEYGRLRPVATPHLLQAREPRNYHLTAPHELAAPLKPVTVVQESLQYYASHTQDDFVPHELLLGYLLEGLQPDRVAATAALRGNRLAAAHAGEQTLLFHVEGAAGDTVTLITLEAVTTDDGSLRYKTERNAALSLGGSEVLQLACCPRVVVALDKSASLYLIARTVYQLVLLRAERSSGGAGSIPWQLTAVAQIKAPQRIAHVCWNPHLWEVAFAVENGALFCSNLASYCTSRTPSSADAAADATPRQLVSARYAKGHLPPPGKGRLVCEYGAHPRQLIYACGSSLWRVTVPPPAQSAVAAHADVDEVLLLPPDETFYGLARAAASQSLPAGCYDPRFLIAATTTRFTLLLDTRRRAAPLLHWQHGLANEPPQHVSVLLQPPQQQQPQPSPTQLPSSDGHGGCGPSSNRSQPLSQQEYGYSQQLSQQQYGYSQLPPSQNQRSQVAVGSNDNQMWMSQLGLQYRGGTQLSQLAGAPLLGSQPQHDAVEGRTLLGVLVCGNYHSGDTLSMEFALAGQPLGVVPPTTTTADAFGAITDGVRTPLAAAAAACTSRGGDGGGGRAAAVASLSKKRRRPLDRDIEGSEDELDEAVDGVYNDGQPPIFCLQDAVWQLGLTTAARSDGPPACLCRPLAQTVPPTELRRLRQAVALRYPPPADELPSKLVLKREWEAAVSKVTTDIDTMQAKAPDCSGIVLHLLQPPRSRSQPDASGAPQAATALLARADATGNLVLQICHRRRSGGATASSSAAEQDGGAANYFVNTSSPPTPTGDADDRGQQPWWRRDIDDVDVVKQRYMRFEKGAPEERLEQLVRLVRMPKHRELADAVLRQVLQPEAGPPATAANAAAPSTTVVELGDQLLPASRERLSRYPLALACGTGRVDDADAAVMRQAVMRVLEASSAPLTLAELVAAVELDPAGGGGKEGAALQTVLSAIAKTTSRPPRNRRIDRRPRSQSSPQVQLAAARLATAVAPPGLQPPNPVLSHDAAIRAAKGKQPMHRDVGGAPTRLGGGSRANGATQAAATATADMGILGAQLHRLAAVVAEAAAATVTSAAPDVGRSAGYGGAGSSSSGSRLGVPPAVAAAEDAVLTHQVALHFREQQAPAQAGSSRQAQELWTGYTSGGVQSLLALHSAVAYQPRHVHSMLPIGFLATNPVVDGAATTSQHTAATAAAATGKPPLPRASAATAAAASQATVAGSYSAPARSASAASRNGSALGATDTATKIQLPQELAAVMNAGAQATYAQLLNAWPDDRYAAPVGATYVAGNTTHPTSKAAAKAAKAAAAKRAATADTTLSAQKRGLLDSAAAAAPPPAAAASRSQLPPPISAAATTQTAPSRPKQQTPHERMPTRQPHVAAAPPAVERQPVRRIDPTHALPGHHANAAPVEPPSATAGSTAGGTATASAGRQLPPGPAKVPMKRKAHALTEGFM